MSDISRRKFIGLAVGAAVAAVMPKLPEPQVAASVVGGGTKVYTFERVLGCDLAGDVYSFVVAEVENGVITITNSDSFKIDRASRRPSAVDFKDLGLSARDWVDVGVLV